MRKVKPTTYEKANVKPTNGENAHFAKEDNLKICQLAGEPLSEHLVIEKTHDQDVKENETSSVFLRQKEGLMSLLFNKPDKA